MRLGVNGLKLMGYKHMNTEFHAMKADEATQALEPSLQGLSQEEAESRLREFGPNELRKRREQSL